MRKWLYEIVLREAASPQDLTSHLNAAMLIALWPRLYLPGGVRRAWEDLHPALRAAAAAAVLAGCAMALLSTLLSLGWVASTAQSGSGFTNDQRWLVAWAVTCS